MADLTGTSRKKYSLNIYIIRVRCTGIVGLNLIMESLVEGADGIAIIS